LAKRSEKKVIANNIKQDTAKSVQSTSDFSIQSLVPDDSSVLSPNGDDDFTQGQAGFPSGGVEGEHVVYKNKDRSRLKDLEKAKTREHIRYAHRDKNKERYMYRDSERLRSASRYRERQRGGYHSLYSSKTCTSMLIIFLTKIFYIALSLLFCNLFKFLK
jgi:hypothetical protein